MTHFPRPFAAYLPWLILPCLILALLGGDALLAQSRPSASAASSLDANAQWGQWRGPLSTGESPSAKPPLQWSEEKNVLWKTPLEGRGHSTPVVWGQRVYLTAAVKLGPPLKEPIPDNAPGSHDNLKVTHRMGFVVMALDRATGKQAWRRQVYETIPHEGGHYTASLASASPITDGRHVYAFFGSHGLFCLDLEGKVLWSRQLGKMHTKHGHGEGSTPVLFGDTLAINWDHEGKSFLLAVDAETGETRWRRERDEVTSWASPIVVSVDGKPQLIVSGTDRVRSYNLASGKVIWECGGLSANIVASPVAADGMVFAASSYDTRAILAIRLAGAKGDITGSKQVVWSRQRSTPYVPSPLLYRGWVYYLRHYQGILSRLRAKDGDEPLGPFRLGGIRNVYASPVAADDRVYIVDQDGLTIVISHSQPRLLAVNELDDRFNASPALAGNQLFLRGEKALYCLAEPSDR